MSNGNTIAFNPCSVCSEKFCLMCELDFRRKGAIKSNEWISVEERLPDKEGTYLVYTDKDNITMDIFCIYPSHGTKFWVGGINGEATHWMPLPEAPKGGAE